MLKDNLLKRNGVKTLYQIYLKAFTLKKNVSYKEGTLLALGLGKNETPFYCEFMDTTRKK